MSDETIELKDLKNIGLTLQSKLKDVGIKSVEDLERIGPVQAYIKLCKQEGRRLPVCYYLYSIEAALKKKDWRALSAAQKAKLLAAVENS